MNFIFRFIILAASAWCVLILISQEPVKQTVAKAPNTFKDLTKSISAEDVRCLAENLYHEARGEPEEGLIAVGIVTINRTKTNLYPSTICGVVYQNNQFSWTLKEHNVSESDLEAFKQLSYKILSNNVVIPVGIRYATHYHTTVVKPAWDKKMQYLQRIGNHVFFKDPKIEIIERKEDVS